MQYRHYQNSKARHANQWLSKSILGALLLCSSTAYAAPLNGKIAFQSNRDGNDEIYVMNPDGTNQTRLTNNPQQDFSVSFNGAGSKIAFCSSRDSSTGDYDIYVMNADGTAQTRLTNNSKGDFEPAFSPDGSKIAFVSNRDGDNTHYEIYIMDADGTHQTRLTTDGKGSLNPSFSPDGRKIAFLSRRDGDEEIYVMNADGTNQTRITGNTANDSRPCFSPDGSKIAFTSDRDRNLEIYVMNADGTNQTRLTNSGRNDFSPCFSPDGSKIAFSSDRVSFEDYETFIMDADGGNPKRITKNSNSVDAEPTWAAAPILKVANAPTINEGSAAAPGSATFAVTLSTAAESTVAVSYTTANNTALAGSDYVARSGTLSFAPGETSTTVTVPFIGDAIAEPNESFFLDIKSPTNATIAVNRANTYIRNDDPPLIFIDDAAPILEGNSGTQSQQFTVRLSAVSTQTVTVSYTTQAKTAVPGDFVQKSGTLTFAPGETQKTISITVNGDTTVEPTETYVVNLKNPISATIADSQGIAYIRNDDLPALLAPDDEASS